MFENRSYYTDIILYIWSLDHVGLFLLFLIDAIFILRQVMTNIESAVNTLE